MRLRLFFLILFFSPLQLISNVSQPNVFIYGEGTTQVNSEISTYENLVAGSPIKGSVMITHDKSAAVDPNSFRLGDKPLKVTLVQSVPMSDYSPTVVTIYSFQIEGMSAGNHTLPPIQVKVGGKDYRAAPLSIQVAQ